jgi:hypothetical protein
MTNQPGPETTPRHRPAIRLAGWGLIAIGLALIPLPGPGLAVVIAGIAVLARESPRARRLLERLRNATPGGRSSKPGPDPVGRA